VAFQEEEELDLFDLLDADEILQWVVEVEVLLLWQRFVEEPYLEVEE
jgi:hypothetical protein